jgi:aminoglycoside 6'-N-acetyltransferase
LIAGRHTRLRLASDDDLDLLAAWFADPAFVQWWGGKPLAREHVADEYIGRRRPSVESMIIEAGEQPVGYIQYWTGEEEGSGGIDVVLVPEAQGRGLGPDAVRALAEHLRLEEGWRRVTVDPSVENRKAIRAFMKAGFVAESEWPDHADGPALLMVYEGSPMH